MAVGIAASNVYALVRVSPLRFMHSQASLPWALVRCRRVVSSPLLVCAGQA